MNILVIGNGFDLAHGLPTKYTDFLVWVKKYQQFYLYATRNRTAEYKEAKEPILQYFNSLFYEDKNKVICNEIYDLIYDNIWIDYFLQNPIYQKENWIDFENEISRFIQSLDSDMHESNKTCNIDDNITTLSNSFLNERYSKYTLTAQSVSVLTDGRAQESITFKEIINKLLDDLNKLIRALEIYLCDYVEKMEIKKKSPDIDGLEIGAILSFNYTHIFTKLYSISSEFSQTIADSCDYIRGEAKINRTIETNNMVLGIDEYLGKKKRNKNVEFITFKKFYQRIHKQTGCKYKEWVDKIKQDYLDHLQKIETAKYKELQYISDTTQRLFNKLAMSEIIREKCQVHNLYIFGHSLDITDGDILRDLILNDNVKTTIFYHNKDAMGQQIANLVKVIGQDELIKRTGGSTKTIEFVPQKPMAPIEN